MGSTHVAFSLGPAGAVSEREGGPDAQQDDPQRDLQTLGIDSVGDSPANDDAEQQRRADDDGQAGPSRRSRRGEPVYCWTELCTRSKDWNLFERKA
ncbi:hypothetical protein A6E15_06330 [Natrinema saccharevitans]|uniref:Uncharacterized protein n=1 Tax=Natrinema saccharevitans TaxID=301967 RepID=A0A1S8AUW8_9EURY|nr:hypothetical protein A6E15_06330 [Natrinema saccharevitans]